MVDAKLDHLLSFHHTHVAVYIVACFAIACAFYDSTQGFVQRYHINKKWFYLYGATCFFAYLYIRPLIRRGLGSAERGYINFYSVYIVWLCSAVFYHLPSLNSLGIDIKADVSLLLTIFVISFVLFLLLHFVHGLLVSARVIGPCLYNPEAGWKEVMSVILLNSMNIAIACSTYYGFCGNASGEGQASSPLKAAVCSKWLHPVAITQRPVFSSWVIYGEAASNTSSRSSLFVDFPLDGAGPIAIPAAETISPVFTLFVTLITMFFVNCVADYGAAITMHTGTVAKLRHGEVELEGWEEGTRKLRRRNSADLSLSASFTLPPDMRRHSSEGHKVRLPGGGILSSQSVECLGSLLRSVADVGTKKWSQVSLPSLVLGGVWGSRNGSFTGSALSRSSSESSTDGRWGQPDVGPPADPGFLPMFPWYSGTSADLLKTMFDLLVSVKVFLGRFDMRTMQASLAGAQTSYGSSTPTAGDGFLYEHLKDREELWFDFCADTGDGGDPTYAVARMMAAPKLSIAIPRSLLNGETTSPVSANQEPETPKGGVDVKELPRADLLIHGGDLAYPTPSREVYETRLFRPYEAAFPPPSHVQSGQLVVTKPDLPLMQDSWGGHCAHKCGGSRAGLRRRQHSSVSETVSHCQWHEGHSNDTGKCQMCAKAETLRRYDGPSCFAIPGNHDWFDGLETFQRHILHKGWLGGWLLPQENSYFALKLPHGWWLFGFDLALVEDIDMCQFRYFAQIADQLLHPDDQVILMTHQPRWLLDWYWGETLSHNLRQLVRGHLKGRARLHIAGDLHFYQRHSYCQPTTPQLQENSQATTASNHQTAAPTHPTVSLIPPHTPPPTVPEHSTQLLPDTTNSMPPPTTNTTSHAATRLPGSSPDSRPIPASYTSHAGSVSDTVPTDLNATPFAEAQSFLHGANAVPSSANHGQAGAGVQRHLNDPEHLVVCGLGGAFLHPTHVFSYAKFKPGLEDNDGPVFVSQDGEAGESGKGTGEYSCCCSYPSPSKSLRLGRDNLHLFRFKNTRFDIIGGLLYYCLVVSVLPRCGAMSSVFDTATIWGAITSFTAAVADTFSSIFLESYVSLAVFLGLLSLNFGFARTGGVGSLHQTVSEGSGGRQQHDLHPSQVVRSRLGGVASQLGVAVAHSLAHLLSAVVLLLLLELGVETCSRYGSVGEEGYHSLYKWYRQFEDQHFPDPMGLRDILSSWTLGLYPNLIKYLMAIFDIPETIAVGRTAICNGQWYELTRVQSAGYYLGVLAYYWLLATPVMGFLFGAYLYIAVNWGHVHYDEAFSSLRIPNHKGFCRFHINKKGDLELYSLVMDCIPCKWHEDPKWRGPKGAGSKLGAPHKAKYPSRWVPGSGGPEGYYPAGDDDTKHLKVVDYLYIPKYRAPS